MTDIQTPALLLDQQKLDANIARMRAHLDAIGVPLRPHVKTAKCVEVVRRACAGDAGPITVSTLAEARYFADQGFRDILYAVGIAPAKLPDVAALRAAGIDLTIILDSPEAAGAVADFAASHGIAIPALIEIDCDGHRSGLRVDDPVLLDVARRLASAGDQALRGVMTHAGGSYDSRSEADLRAAARNERASLVEAAQRLDAAGLPCPVRSAGSTPTALFADGADGLTEIRAGVFMFQDLVMAGIGVCAVEDIALSVLATVIGHQRDKGWIIVDAGWMAMSRDRGTAAQAVDQGYGLVCDERGVPIPDLMMFGANQEHGIIAVRPTSDARLPELPIGARLRILPNHACATASQHDRYHIVTGGSAPIGEWPRFGGW